MREIKFRAWHSETKDMYYMSKREYFGQTAILDPMVGHDTAIWMQYTGLKDKYDNEIYEGDIVEERYNNPLAGGEVIERYKIETSKSSIIKMLHSSGLEKWDRFLWMRYKGLEVVGNIYENPELLN